MLGAQSPRGIPLDLASREMGESVAAALGANQAVSNHKLRALGWRPRYPTYREGIPPTLRELSALDRRI
jgi:hypothetical protein